MKVVRASEVEYEPASHEDPKNPGVLKKVLATKTDLAEGQVPMLNWSLLKRGKAFQRHYHEDMQEIFIILSGEVSVTIENASNSGQSDAAPEEMQPLRLKGGDVILIDPGEIHSMRNISSGDVEYVVFGIATGQGGKTIVVGES